MYGTSLLIVKILVSHACYFLVILVCATERQHSSVYVAPHHGYPIAVFPATGLLFITTLACNSRALKIVSHGRFWRASPACRSKI